jgi:4-hydroxybenzoate polyprenyltransferase
VLTALVPLLVIFYEWPALYKYYALNATSVPKMTILFYWVGSFALFAFVTTLAREIIKDIEDFEGDLAYGRSTLPVITGIPVSKMIAIGLVTITIAMLFLVWFFFVRDWITMVYMLIAILMPLVLVIFFLVSGTTRKKLHSASNMMKIAMLTGILYSLIVKAIVTWKLL